MDAGNVWLLNNETQRPGGEFRIKGLLKEIALGTGFGLRYDFPISWSVPIWEYLYMLLIVQASPDIIISTAVSGKVWY